MANVNGVSSNSYSSSLYNTANTITGLASGMDTESMIENLVSAYQTKITSLQQSQTKIEWKQDAYRELIDQMANITNKYTSFTSKTNLTSNSFFTSNMTTSANGSNASAVSATGRAGSELRINAVEQMASNARYAVDASALSLGAAGVAKGQAIDWTATEKVGQANGSLTFKYGGQSFEISFGENDVDITSAEKLRDAIASKFSDVNITTSKGTTTAASLFKVTAEEDGSISFSVNGSNPIADGSSIYINGYSGNLATTLGASRASGETANRIKNNSLKGIAYSSLVKEQNTAAYLSGKTVDVTLDGVNKQVKLGDLSGTKIELGEGEDKESLSIEETLAELNKEGVTETRKSELKAALNSTLNKAVAKELQSGVNKQFGSGRVTVAVDESGALRFDLDAKSGSTIKVTSAAGERLGIGESGVSNYLNTGRTLKDLVGGDDGLAWLNESARIGSVGTIQSTAEYYDAKGNRVNRSSNGYYYQVDDKGAFKTSGGSLVAASGDVHTMYRDGEGNLVMRDADKNYYRADKKGDWLYQMEINDVKLGEFTKSSTLENVMSQINSNADVGVSVSFSSLSGQFVFKARETGSGGKIDLGEGLAARLFKVDNTPKGQTLSDLFGSDVWDSEGSVTIRLSTPAQIADLETSDGSGETTVTFRKGDSVESLMSAMNSAARGAFNLQLAYDAKKGAYSLTNRAGAALSDETAAMFTLSVSGAEKKSLTMQDLLKAANRSDTASFTEGKDAVVNVTVNGKEMNLTRSTNVINMDGLSVTLKETFDARKYDEDGVTLLKESDGSSKVDSAAAVTFTSSSNSDAIVDAIRGFVEDMNKVMSDVHKAYTTQPLKKNSKSTKRDGYEPLTEEDKKDMSESAIKAYEDKGKTGLLFGDTDLSGFYNKMLTALQSSGGDRIDLESIGITTSFSGGVTTLNLNEEKLRSALTSDPDKVRSIFTKTVDTGAESNGLMARVKNVLNAYASTSFGNQGVLVRKAGTKLSSLSLLNNNLQTQYDALTTQIEKWQSKLSDKVDYYTKQFATLEKLMSSYNNQSSMLSQLSGGY